MVQLRARADVRGSDPKLPGVWLDDWPVALAVVQFPEECPLTDELLMQLGELNTYWQFERTATGGLQMSVCGWRDRRRARGRSDVAAHQLV